MITNDSETAWRFSLYTFMCAPHQSPVQGNFMRGIFVDHTTFEPRYKHGFGHCLAEIGGVFRRLRM